MEQLLGFVAQQESGNVCSLKKSVYELKQSPRAWFRQFASVIRAFIFLILIRITLYFGNKTSREEVTPYNVYG